MGLILWIDQNAFASGLIERVFKKKQLPFYTLPGVEDFSYLVEDLNPVLIVLDGETFKKAAEKFRLQYEASEKMQEIPFVFLDPVSDMDFIKNKLGEIHRPIDPFKLPAVLEEFFKAN